MKNDQKDTSFVGHLVELRERLIHSIVFLFILFAVSYFFSEEIYSFLVNPYAEAVKDNNLDNKYGIWNFWLNDKHNLSSKFFDFQMFLRSDSLLNTKFTNLDRLVK